MVTISYPKAGRRIEVSLTHAEGLTLKQYCKQVTGLIGVRMRCNVVNPQTRERLRLAHVPRDGETIVFELAGR